MIQERCNNLAVVLMLLVACAARGQDVRPFASGDQIAIGEIDHETGAPIGATRVFPALFDEFYAVNNPGFLAAAGDLPGSRDLGWDFQPMTLDSGPNAGYRSTLLYWDGVGATPNFGPTPTQAYRLTLFGRNQGVAAGGADSIIPGDVIERTNPNGSIHEHRFFFLDDNGDGLNTTLPAPGVYLLAMTLRMNGLEDSEPFFFVWGTEQPSVIPAVLASAAWVEARVDTLVALEGDFNLDGLVDAADYTVWRDGQGTTFDASDYVTWETNYGAGQGASSGAMAAAAPEPSGLLGLGLAVAIASATKRRSL